jgi:hypothetical protein
MIYYGKKSRFIFKQVVIRKQWIFRLKLFLKRSHLKRILFCKEITFGYRSKINSSCSSFRFIKTTKLSLFLIFLFFRSSVANCCSETLTYESFRIKIIIYHLNLLR